MNSLKISARIVYIFLDISNFYDKLRTNERNGGGQYDHEESVYEMGEHPEAAGRWRIVRFIGQYRAFRVAVFSASGSPDVLFCFLLLPLCERTLTIILISIRMTIHERAEQLRMRGDLHMRKVRASQGRITANGRRG